MMKEAKQELWRKWRNKKEKKQDKGPQKVENMEQALIKVELEVEKYKKEVELEKEAQEKRKDRIRRKKEKERHWEMLRWIVTFIEKNKDGWDRRRKEQIERTNWLDLTEEERKKEFEEQKLKRDKTTKCPETKRKERLELAKKLKEDWKSWRETGEEREDHEQQLHASPQTSEEERSDRDLQARGEELSSGYLYDYKARGEGSLIPSNYTSPQARGEGKSDPSNHNQSQARGEEQRSCSSS